MTQFTITLSDTGSKGRYSLRAPGVAEEAEMTFSRANPTLIIADHTYTPDAMRGMGAGKALFDRLVADARAGGYKIIPLCPFVLATARKHPELADIFQM